MTNRENYRHIKSIREEGFTFHLVLRYVAYFYINIMKGRIRRDGPDTLMKYSRDWEYPWTLIKSEIEPGCRALDCGSGYSPIPFIWSVFGAQAHAIDRDIMICARFTYALYCLRMLVLDIIRLPLSVFQKKKAKKNILSKTKKETGLNNNNEQQDCKKTNLVVKIFRSLGLCLATNRFRMRRIWKTDFWGPISPRMLKKYKLDYQKGNLTSLPYADSSFDVVSCISVLEHMPDNDQVQGIKEMSRVLKQGGKLIITYDKREQDLTDIFIQASGMTPSELVFFAKPDNLYNSTYAHAKDVIGICLIK